MPAATDMAVKKLIIRTNNVLKYTYYVLPFIKSAVMRIQGYFFIKISEYTLFFIAKWCIIKTIIDKRGNAPMDKWAKSQ